MDWNWFLFSFAGRINPAKIWFAAFIWFATVFSFMTIFMIFLFAIGGMLRASGCDVHMESSKTMHPAFYLLGLPLLVTFVWLFAATAIKRLHDRDKSGWWLLAFYAFPAASSYVDDVEGTGLPYLFSLVRIVFSLWGFVELGCLRGTPGPNRFGPNPLAG